MQFKPSARSRFLLVPLLLFCLPVEAARKDKEPPSEEASAIVPELLKGFEWRNIGPYRGGRVTAVTGVSGDPLTYYFGATGGGLWRTEDAGNTWQNLTDGQVKTGSVGAIAVAPSDANVLYLGMGEAQIRGVTTSHGDGVYKSLDGGRTWTHQGLAVARQIARIRVHPSDPNLVYVAAQGNPWVPNEERGIYRSRNGGALWERVLHVDERTGASDLALDPKNPRVLYAALWEHQRLPWKVMSGGPGSGLFKTTDGGDTWEKLTGGLPEMMGKVAVAVSPTHPDRVWALVEADDGGLFRSDDGGKTFLHINRDRELRARAWYYTKVFADPQDEHTVYVMNAPMLRSIDGGKTFTRIRTPHGDHHDLWIAPEDSRRMIHGSDGGASVSFNGGSTWSPQDNQPTGQFYRVITDGQFPYRVYGGQQDNSTVAILSRSDEAGINRRHWFSVGGCESAHIAFVPRDPRLIYAGCYQGLINEYDVESGHQRDIMAYPYLGLGADAQDLVYRFNWNAPIIVSPHDPQVLYHAGNLVLRSRDRGNSWLAISPDLTRNEVEKQGPGGGPLTNEAAGAETYNTIFYLVESPHRAGELWVGTDDGLVHRTRDDGATWENVTPPDLGEAQINTIEVSPHDAQTLYLSVTRYKFGDLAPLIYRTIDGGESWELRVDGLEEASFVRVVREDPARRDLLYAGTETGLYLSVDGGGQWQAFQGNLPVVPVTDLTLRAGDLVAATQGRAFWILDNLTPLHQLTDEVAVKDLHLFAPRAAIRLGGSDGETPLHQGQNPPRGAILYYSLSQKIIDQMDAAEAEGEEPMLEMIIEDEAGNLLRRYTSREEPPYDPEIPVDHPARWGYTKREPLPKEVGLNRFVWDLERDQVSRVGDLFVFAAKKSRVTPGPYTVRLSIGGYRAEQILEVRSDPRRPLPAASFTEQKRLVDTIWQRVDHIHMSVVRLRGVRRQLESLLERSAHLPSAEVVENAGRALLERLEAWEEPLVQPRQKTFQDVINFPNRLNSQYLFLMETIDDSDPPVTAGARQRFADLETLWAEHEAALAEILEIRIPAFNALVREHEVPALIVAPKAGEGPLAQ